MVGCRRLVLRTPQQYAPFAVLATRVFLVCSALALAGCIDRLVTLLEGGRWARASSAAKTQVRLRPLDPAARRRSTDPGPPAGAGCATVSRPHAQTVAMAAVYVVVLVLTTLMASMPVQLRFRSLALGLPDATQWCARRTRHTAIALIPARPMPAVPAPVQGA